VPLLNSLGSLESFSGADLRGFFDPVIIGEPRLQAPLVTSRSWS
jgi:hypothetical protein